MRGKKIVPYVQVASLPGNGTSGDPYTISSAADWDLFARNITYGNSYSGKYVKLTQNISVTQKCGYVSGNNPAKAFSGTFDGGGKTITATITDTDNQGTALFRYINGATIKNVLVAGTINGGMHAAAIVGFAKGTGNSMTNCAAIASVSGGSHIGGLLGNALDGDMAITGCVYAGMMTGGDTAKGAIFGWGDDVAFGPVPARSVTDCLYIMLDGQNTENLDLVKGHGSVTVTNCYKTTMAEYEAQNGQNARSLSRPISPISPSAPLNDEEDDYDITDLESYGIWANVYDTMPDYFGDLLMDYGFLKVYEGGLECDGYYIVACISLAANADNSALISLATDYIVDVTLTDRTFRKDGSWQTLCLPFDVALEGSPLEGAKVMTLGNSEVCATGFDAATGTLTLEFVDAFAIEAGVAYIVKWEDTEAADLKNPMFRGVTVEAEAPETQSTVSRDGYVQFLGTYSPVDIYTAEKTNLYLDADGMLCCPWGEGMTAYNVNACTAYFQLLNGLTAGDADTDIRAVRLIFGADDPVGIKEIEDGRWKIENEAGAWFTLDGRKIVNSKSSNRKLNRGVYINNGKKFVK